MKARAVLLPLGTLLLLSVTAAAFAQPDAASLGPAPRGEDGRFTNAVGELGHGGFAVRFPFLLRRFAGAFRDRPGGPDFVPNDGAFLRDYEKHGTPTVTWIGHATLLVQMDGVTFLTDPIWSDSPSPVSFVGPTRFVAPGLGLDQLPKIDFVIVSHNHYDHLDIPTLVALAERDPATRFFVPMGNGALLKTNGVENVDEFDWGDSQPFLGGGGGVRIFSLPSQHWSKRGLNDDNDALWSSWAVVGAERRIYFAGDTGYSDGFARIGEVFGFFDLAAVPVGAYEPRAMMRASHMAPDEAVKAALDVRASRAVAMHFGTFDLSDEPLDEPPVLFRKAAVALGLGEAAAWVLRIGETRKF